MKRIGIATFQYADNYGAILQCYALHKLLSDLEDVSVSVINFIPPQFKYKRMYNSETNKAKWLRKHNEFMRFLTENCDLEETPSSYIGGENYDYIFVGSDQVWNPLGKEKEFFLPNVSNEVKKIAYAASVGCSVEVARKSTDTFEKYVKEFYRVSIREKEHVEFISSITKKTCECVLDPTLMIDVSEYERLAHNQSSSNEKYVLFYWLDHGNDLYKMIPIVSDLAVRYGLKIKHTIFDEKSDVLFPESECIFYCGVEEFVGLIKNASCVITNSYHATIFSIRFNIPFFTYVVNSMRSRFDTLLSYSDFSDRIITGITMVDLDKDIEFKRINNELDANRQKSLDYIKESIT